MSGRDDYPAVAILADAALLPPATVLGCIRCWQYNSDKAPGWETNPGARGSCHVRRRQPVHRQLMMGRRRTCADMNAAAVRRWSDRPDILPTYRPPVDAERLFVTSQYGCLTHLTRWVIERATGRLCLESHCGLYGYVGPSLPRRGAATLVPLDDELFACHTCLAICERAGIPTFNLVPANGCEASGGTRFRPWRTRGGDDHEQDEPSRPTDLVDEPLTSRPDKWHMFIAPGFAGDFSCAAFEALKPEQLKGEEA